MGDAKRRRDPANEQVKCVRAECSRTTRTPKAAGWGYVDPPSEAPHWAGWWCPQCVRSLQRFMATQGILPTVGRVQ
jgi:hypothetical protein